MSAERDSRLAPPGAEPRPAALAERLWAAYRAKGADYEPRTEHRNEDGSPVYVNRLILEDSPYLIQHAHNPVDWFPWGEEAFDKARREDKPIFLSSGYSTCHWCHVMERESFDHEDVGRLMNESFVSIKIDREQLPDVDEVYMTAVQLVTGHGGWPMTTFLTPDGKPYFGGTYYPRTIFLDLLRQGAGAWATQPSQVAAQADRIAAAVAQVTTAAGQAGEVGDELIAAGVRGSLSRHDPRLGGFSSAPKFPHEPEILLLLHRALRLGDVEALAAAETSLERMARGGIYDQVGGGFHRYATDAEWLVPHFEKMLYNQAHLARAYLEAFALTGNELYERVARQTLDYVLRDMTSPDGAFYSATDADSEGAEGTFFVWTPAELRAALEGEAAELAIEVFGVTEGGNFEGRNILHLPVPLAEVATRRDMELADLYARVDGIRERLYEVREGREHPLRDEKVVTAWNGMMIAALGRAAEVFGRGSGSERAMGASGKAARRYLEAAEKAAGYLWERSRREDGGLWRIHYEDSSSVHGNLKDFAYLAEALVTLYDTTSDPIWLDRARELADAMLARFWDGEAGGFFLSADDHDGRLLTRPKNPTDGAIPSGNSVAVRVLARLAVRTGETDYRRRAEETVAAFAGMIRQHPSGFSYMLLATDELLHGDAGPLAYGVGGRIRARAALAGDGDDALTVRLDTSAGWHVNAHEPLRGSLAPTELTLLESDGGVALEDVRYPPAETSSLDFPEAPTAAYQGTVSITARLAAEPGVQPRVAHLGLSIQACDDRRCLPPETLRLDVPLPR